VAAGAPCFVCLSSAYLFARCAQRRGSNSHLTNSQLNHWWRYVSRGAIAVDSALILMLGILPHRLNVREQLAVIRQVYVSIVRPA